MILAAVAALVIAVIPLAAAHPPGGDPGAGESHVENPRRAMEEVGFHPLHDHGFNTDVWAWVGDDDRLYATSGTWGTLPILGAPVEGDPCPSETDVRAAPQKSGVKIIDATDPSDPQLISSIGVSGSGSWMR